jgi:hypothetical protein
MFQRFGLLILGLALALGSCGRQITPDSALGITSNGLVSGTMQITFKTAGPLDYTNVGYWIVFNTTGSGTSPYPQFLSNPTDYSYAFVLGAAGRSYIGNQAVSFLQYYSVPGSATVLSARLINTYAQNQLIAQLPGNGQANQFTITFQRSLLNQVSPTEQCSTGTTTATSPTPAATATASTGNVQPVPVGGTATPSPGTSASPGASATPCGQAASTWYVNFFTTDASGNPLDSLGYLGAKDNQYVLQLDTTQPCDDVQQLTRQAGSTEASNPSAAITGGEIINAP